MRYIYIVVLAIMVGCGGGGGGGGPIDNTPIDNAPHIIEFTQPDEYVDGQKMSVPSAVGGYYLYVCHVVDGTMVDNMVWVAEISTNTNPLNYDGAWKGRWDILNLIADNAILGGTRPDGTHAFALKAVSTTYINGKPDVSLLSIPWIYGNPSISLDNTQLPQEGDPLAPHSNLPVHMLFDLNSGNK